jgi:hypothetical protein
MRRKRFLLIGEPIDPHGSGFAGGAPGNAMYVNAADPDAAAHRGRYWFAKVDEVREVPWDEGRSWLWRLWRWLRS